MSEPIIKTIDLGNVTLSDPRDSVSSQAMMLNRLFEQIQAEIRGLDNPWVLPGTCIPLSKDTIAWVFCRLGRPTVESEV